MICTIGFEKEDLKTLQENWAKVIESQRWSEGDFTNTLDIDQKDEIGILAGSLNHMVSSLGTMVKDLKTGVLV